MMLSLKKLWKGQLPLNSNKIKALIYLTLLHAAEINITACANFIKLVSAHVKFKCNGFSKRLKQVTETTISTAAPVTIHRYYLFSYTTLQMGQSTQCCHLRYAVAV